MTLDDLKNRLAQSEKIKDLINSQDQIILTIDGPDGSGKATVSALVNQFFFNMGIQSMVISPPFYDSKAGSIVKDYLMNGPKCIQSRKLISDLYAFDRNMWYMEHFDDVFRTASRPKVVIFNRSWISNLLYQTTIRPAGESDVFEELTGAFYVYKRTEKNDQLVPWYVAFTFDDVYHMLQHPENDLAFSNAFPALQYAFDVHRIHMIQDMIKHIYDTEILPWKINGIPFIGNRDGITICNIILNPGLANIDILRSNMDTRYQNDDSKKDRNENRDFLWYVIENIGYIDGHMHEIFAPSANANVHTFDLIPTDPTVPCFDDAFYKMATEPSGMTADIERAFTFHVMPTTFMTSNDNRYLGLVDYTNQYRPMQLATSILTYLLDMIDGRT